MYWDSPSIYQDIYHICQIIPNADQCPSIKIKFQELIPMWINTDHCRSIPINTDQFCSIKVDADQYQSLLDQRLFDQWEILLIWSSNVWQHLIGIDLYWERLIFVDQNWSTMIFIEPHLRSIPEIWSLLIGIDWHCGLILHVLMYEKYRSTGILRVHDMY